MSLRLRLALAFLAVVSLILVVGITSYSINRQVRGGVAELRSGDMIDLRRLDLSTVGLEIEGSWNEGGSFVAKDVEIVPALTRPRLRGAIQAIDLAAGTLRLYGLTIHFPDDVQSVEEGERVRLEELSVGQRIELTCSVEDGLWEAQKLQREGVKGSDKVKGSVTSADLDGEAPETVTIAGLLVVIQPYSQGSPESALRHIETATRLSLALQECRAAAFELVGHRLIGGFPESSLADRREDEDTTSIERLRQAGTDFAYYASQAQVEPEDAARNLPAPDLLRWVQPLAREQPRLQAGIEQLVDLAARQPAEADRFLDASFSPLLSEELQPLVHAYLSQAEERLGDQLRGVLDRTATTTRVALWATLVAVAMALVLGGLVWRSIHVPLQALHGAALRLGEGHLDTRVELRARDEIGDLARAFNHMASALAATTVSVENLEGVLDSMAGALILFDPQGRITSLNRATLELLGYERAQLLGQPLEKICKRENGALPMRFDGHGVLVSAERTFLRSDGSEVPVSFSGAELRSGGGPLQGYVCVAQDLTAQKAVEAQVRASLAEKELLLREVHHRVKNNMQVVSSLLAMQSMRASDPATVAAFEQSQDRIRSMALIHEQLYRSDDLASIDIGSYLKPLTQHLQDSVAGAGRMRIELDVTPLSVDVDQALACGLIVNELVTNALKHAYPDGREGVVRVRLAPCGEGECMLSVADDGPGLGEAQEGRPKTLGLSLVQTLARQLRGRVELGSGPGTEVRVIFRAQETAGAP